jgi:predicted RNA-binding protein associated with RNAse of E/G family
MNEWNKATQHIKFESEMNVLLKIDQMQHKKKSLLQKMNEALNYEVTISTSGLVALCSIFVIALGLRVSNISPQNSPHSITVINERGQYEKTY